MKINGIDVGFADHSIENTIYVSGALTNDVSVKRGRLQINIVTPALALDRDLHNGLLDDSYYDRKRNIKWLRFVTTGYKTRIPYEGLPYAAYGTAIQCPYAKRLDGFVVSGFPADVEFYGDIFVKQESEKLAYVHIVGELKLYEDAQETIPIDIIKTFEAKPFIESREMYNLETAKQQNPLEVYHLGIAQGIFTEFPEEVLAYKNLERLSFFGQADLKITELPERFYDLTQLHSLNIYGSDIEVLSEKISQLQRLEELNISYSQLKRIPDAICQLTQLDTIDFKDNNLTELPDCIATMVNLKSLDVENNDFTKLPQKLDRIPHLCIDRKHQKLFKDTAYVSQNKQPIDKTIFDLTHYPTEKAALQQKLAVEPILLEYADFILSCTTMATYLKTQDTTIDIALGASKVGGAPDLPPELAYPVDSNEELYIFHAQINCEDIAGFQRYLPRTGILYFFVNDEEDANKPVVLFTNNIQQLVRYEYPDEVEFIDDSYDHDAYTAVGLTFANHVSLPQLYNAGSYASERYPEFAHLWNVAEDDELHWEKMDGLEEVLMNLNDSGERSHGINTSVFTQHESPQEQAAAKFGGEPCDWLVLLNMESMGDFCFWDAGTLTYCIHKKDLAIADFSRVHVSIESS